MQNERTQSVYCQEEKADDRQVDVTMMSPKKMKMPLQTSTNKDKTTEDRFRTSSLRANSCCVHNRCNNNSMVTVTTGCGGINRIMTRSLAISLISISVSCIVSRVTSFQSPRQQTSLSRPSQHYYYTPITTNTNNSPIASASSSLRQSSDASEGTVKSKRSQRKAAQRAKKQRQQSQSTTKSSVNKATSQHPEAILKRQRQKQANSRVSGGSNHTNKRRNHNFAQRAEYLNEGTDNYNFGTQDQLTLTSTTTNNGQTKKANTVHSHQLHSQRVSKLDEKTTADDVVRAIKRAQNLHDIHDIVEIAQFLLKEVGEFSIICVD